MAKSNHVKQISAKVMFHGELNELQFGWLPGTNTDICVCMCCDYKVYLYYAGHACFAAIFAILTACGRSVMVDK